MHLKRLLLFLLTCLSGCQLASDSAKPVALIRQQFVYAGPGRCDTTANKGVSVRVNYVLLKESEPNASVTNGTIRAQIIRSITGWIDSTSLVEQPKAQTDLNEAARLFSTDYQQLKEDVGVMGGCWEIEIKSDTVCSCPNFLTVGLETYTYTGGAHPNTYTTLLSFDRRTGKAMCLTDLVADTTALLPLVEQAFRKQQGVKAQESLEDEGYFLQDGRFFLPENVAVGRDGLIFYYNPYEIAAYALGPIEVIVPYSELTPILKNDGLPRPHLSLLDKVLSPARALLSMLFLYV